MEFAYPRQQSHRGKAHRQPPRIMRNKTGKWGICCASPCRWKERGRPTGVLPGIVRCCTVFPYAFFRMKHGLRAGTMPAMRHSKNKPSGPGEDLLVTRARRKESMRSAIKLFRLIMDAEERHAAWVTRQTGMEPARIWALWELGQAPGLRAVDLARAMAIQRNMAETLLQRLERDGLVSTHGVPVSYTLTQAGMALAQSFPEHAQGALMSAFAQLPDAALERLVQALRPLVEVLPFREEGAALQPLPCKRAPTHDQARISDDAGPLPVKRLQHARSN